MLGEVNINITNLVHTNLRRPIQRCAYFNLDLELIQNGETPATNPRIISTEGGFRLRYSPGALKSNKDKPFIFKWDFLEKEVIRLNGWEDFLELSQRDERVGFLKKYSNITENSFKISKANVGMDIFFSIDMEKYIHDVCEKNGIEIDYSILRSPEINEAEKLRHKTFLEVNSVHDVEV